jgi:hypothetical protein
MPTPTDPASEPKPGYKTTEFWLALAATVVGAAFASNAFPSESSGDKLLGLAAIVLASLGYTVSRTMVKR